MTNDSVRMCFNLEDARAALKDNKELLSAFVWERMPQGSDFWIERYRNGYSENDEALGILRDMIAQGGEREERSWL